MRKHIYVEPTPVPQSVGRSLILSDFHCVGVSGLSQTSYIFWKLWPTAFRRWFTKRIFPKCIFPKCTRLTHLLSLASLFHSAFRHSAVWYNCHSGSPVHWNRPMSRCLDVFYFWADVQGGGHIAVCRDTWNDTSRPDLGNGDLDSHQFLLSTKEHCPLLNIKWY